VNCIQFNDIEFLNAVQSANFNYENEQFINYTVPIDTEDGVTMTSNVNNYSYISLYNTSSINISTQCENISFNLNTDSFITIKNSTTGDINFVQEGNVKTSCISVNASKVSNLSYLQDNISMLSAQVSTSTNYLIVAIVVFVLLGITVFVSLFVVLFKKPKTKISDDKPRAKIVLYENENKNENL